jgi:hypothetical protein
VADQPHLVRPPPADRLAGDEHLHRHRPRDLPGQSHGRPRHGEQAPLHLAHGDLRALGRDPDVERLQDLDPAGVAVALDGGDDRRPRPEVLEEPLVDQGDVLADALLELVLGGLARRERPHEPVEVGAGREVTAGAGHDRRPHVVVGVDHVPCLAQPAEGLGVERVAFVGPVERDRDDVAVPFHEYRGF